MIVDDINFTLKDGRKAILRSPREEDSERILNFIISACIETDFLLNYPEEFKHAVDSERQFLSHINLSENSALLVCYVDGEVVGDCQIDFYTNKKRCHRANVGIAVAKNFWNNGIGSKMFTELIRIAENREGVEQIELEVFEGNSRARALYEKFGFRIVGVRPDAYKLKDGTRLNEYIMIKKLR